VHTGVIVVNSWVCIWILSNFIGGAWWDVAQFVWKYSSCAFCVVLVGLSAYSLSMCSLWMGVLVLFQRPWFPLSIMFLVPQTYSYWVPSLQILKLPPFNQHPHPAGRGTNLNLNNKQVLQKQKTNARPTTRNMTDSGNQGHWNDTGLTSTNYAQTTNRQINRPAPYRRHMKSISKQPEQHLTKPQV
jgi:hypothetical protein